jgi:phosphoenolpyruvate carboxykinase (ATP)
LARPWSHGRRTLIVQEPRPALTPLVREIPSQSRGGGEGPRVDRFSLSDHGLTVETVHRNLSPARLYEEAIRHEPGSCIADSGALVAYSGVKTGRSPKDKRIVRRPPSEADVWWGPVNVPLDPDSFLINRERAVDYLNTRDRLYCFDGFAGWDPDYRLKIRVVCSRPYHALFMHTMLIRPTADELAGFGKPDYVIFNAGEFPANRHTAGMTSKTSVDLNFEDGEVVILGTEYAGEMKKGVFTVTNYLMPKRGVLSMHCSATADPVTGRSSVLFGLSGTGKTTLSADPKRQLVGDDEHCWTDRGIFNIEGGCYAKAIHLTPENEPDIFRALRFGAVLENVVVGEENRQVDFHDVSITENTRGAYPIEFIRTAKIPCIADHPTDVIFLTCDAFGVLPPVSRLSPAHAMYHFISGYTAKVAGTEMGVSEPQATFSSCFGGPFLVWHPGKYAELLAAKMRQHRANVWLVNTGWTGGPYGTGTRIPLVLTRSIIDAINAGALAAAPTQPDPVFGIDVVTACPNVPAHLLIPRNTWKLAPIYDATARKLAGLFRQNFAAYESGVGAEVRAAGPRG